MTRHRIAFTKVAQLVAAVALSASALGAGLRVEPWGATPAGVPVERVTLENQRGMRLAYIDYGATLVAVEVPDREGKLQNVVLSLPTLEAYEHTHRRFGAIIGRYAGRIGHARFTLGGKVIELVPALKGNAIHGDPDGFDRRVWTRKDFSERDSLGSVFHLVSPNGDQKMPGKLDVTVTYRLYRQRNEFRIEYAAKTDAPTVLNLTNHCFFNLAGAGSTGLADHSFQINAGRYAVTDATRLPTGELAGVEGGPLDFRQPAKLIDRLAVDTGLLGNPPGYDHSLVIDQPLQAGDLALAATIEATASGRRMQIWTTQPAVQFNTANGFDGSEIGSEGIGYRRFDGFALETQHLPDSPNHPNFPSTLLDSGKAFHAVTSYRFSVLPARHETSNTQ